MNTLLLFKKRTIFTRNDGNYTKLCQMQQKYQYKNIIFVKGFKKKMN